MEKKKDNLTFFNKHVKETLLVIIFKKENNFNYKVSNYKNIAIKTSSKLNINILNQTNIVVAAVKVFKKHDKPLKVISFNSKNIVTAALKSKQERLKSNTINVLSSKCIKKCKYKKLE